ncbi:hypothetical protein D4Z78_24085 [Okeania hirsuta]|nr:hypothetical protein D4Z78_24085 [Okeania hirsuta]
MAIYDANLRFSRTILGQFFRIPPNYSYVCFSPTPLFPLLGGVRGGSPTQQNVEKFLRNGIISEESVSPVGCVTFH